MTKLENAKMSCIAKLKQGYEAEINIGLSITHKAGCSIHVAGKDNLTNLLISKGALEFMNAVNSSVTTINVYDIKTGEKHNVTLQEISVICGSASVWGHKQYNHMQSLMASVRDATTVEDVISINWYKAI